MLTAADACSARAVLCFELLRSLLSALHSASALCCVCASLPSLPSRRVCVCFRLGQCGNQVGAAFFEQMAQQLCQPETTSGSTAAGGRMGSSAAAAQRFEPTPIHQRSAFQRGIASRFFRSARRRGADGTAAGSPAESSAALSTPASPLPVARAVLLDMEPKVIRSAYTSAAESGCFAYDARRSFARQSGSGNNCKGVHSGHATHDPAPIRKAPIANRVTPRGACSEPPRTTTHESAECLALHGDAWVCCAALLTRWFRVVCRLPCSPLLLALLGAFGYSKHGLECREPMLDLVRKEVESCSSLGGMLLMTSLAGGTGSGVGASLAEALRDTYPSIPLLNQVVWPYSQGEVIVQNYNALLTLAHLQEYSDGLVVFENDALATVCTRRLGRATPSFPEMNNIIAKSLVQAFAPAVMTQAQPFYVMPAEREDAAAGGVGGGATASSRSKMKLDSSSGSGAASSSSSSKPKFLPPSDASLLSCCPSLHLWSDVLSTLFPHPSLKLSTLRCLPQVSSAALAFQSNSWTSLLKSARQMVITGHSMEDGLDWSVAAESAEVTMGKRRWHQHFSASARAVCIYDVGTTFDAGQPSPDAATSFLASASSTAAAGAFAGAASFATAAAAASSAGPPFDQPLPVPPHVVAYLDGESYLEHRLRGEVETLRARQARPYDHAQVAATKRAGCGVAAAAAVDVDSAESTVSGSSARCLAHCFCPAPVHPVCPSLHPSCGSRSARALAPVSFFLTSWRRRRNCSSSRSAAAAARASHVAAVSALCSLI